MRQLLEKDFRGEPEVTPLSPHLLERLRFASERPSVLTESQNYRTLWPVVARECQVTEWLTNLTHKPKVSPHSPLATPSGGTTGAMPTVNRGGAKAALPKVKTVEWLHLSDFHFHSTASQPRDRVLKSLCADLEESISNGWKPDFVAVTGDLAYSGDPDQLSRAWDYLRRILAICNLPKQQLFVVPGNRRESIGTSAHLAACTAEGCGRPDPQRSMPKYQQSLGC
jgi:hypothetical protein